MASNRFPYFLAGLGIGVAAGLLCAPRRGADTRADIARAMEDGRGYVSDTSDGLRAAATDAVQRGKEVVQSQRDLLQSALDAGVKAYNLAHEDES